MLFSAVHGDSVQTSTTLLRAGPHPQVTKSDAKRGADPHPGVFRLQVSPVRIFFTSLTGLAKVPSRQALLSHDGCVTAESASVTCFDPQF